MYYIYVIQSLDDEDRFYLGYSSDLKSRIKFHNEGKTTSTKNAQWRLVYYESYTSKSYALKRERSLKQNSNMRAYLMKRIKESLKIT